MPKIPLGTSPRPDPNDPSLNEAQRTEAPIPAIPISTKELMALGLENSNVPVINRTASPAHPNDKVAAFVHLVAPAATEAAAKLNVPVEAVISQWALESGWGQSELAAKYNNFGGVKALGSSWKGNVVRMPSYEKDRSYKEVSPFRVYDSVEGYAKDYTNFLAGNPRYKSVLGTNSVGAFGTELGKAGYHQDRISDYSKNLESIAKRVRKYLVTTDAEE